MNRMKRQPKHGGFTLLEVLIAVAIAGMAIVMLLQTHNGTLRLYERYREMTIAQHIARELISEIEAGGYPGDTEEDGDVHDKYPGFAWHRTCTKDGVEEDFEGPAPGVYKVIVTIKCPLEEYMMTTHLMENAP